MADEASITLQMSIKKVSGTIVQLDEKYAASFRLDVEGTEGPTPGSLIVPTGGKVIPMGELLNPGLCWFKNRSDTYYVTVGIRDPGSNVFYPLMEIGPGEAYIVKLSRDLLEEYSGTGTGTTSAGNQLFAKAIGGEVSLAVEAYER